jgi:hypothetical protein
MIARQTTNRSPPVVSLPAIRSRLMACRLPPVSTLCAVSASVTALAARIIVPVISWEKCAVTNPTTQRGSRSLTP